jgi:biotin synthase-like enzyme
MNINSILQNALERELYPEEALILLANTKSTTDIIKLIRTAERVTRAAKGNEIYLISKISPNIKCVNSPSCKYCGTNCNEKEKMTVEEFDTALNWMKEKGVTHLEFAETTADSEAKDIIPYLERLKDTGIKYWVNVGHNLSESALSELKAYNANGIASSFEVVGENAFKKYRVGDNIIKRWNHLYKSQELGLKFYNYLMIGSGETFNERIEYFKKLKESAARLHLILLPWSNGGQAMDLVKTGAVCRLLSWDWDLDIGGKDLLNFNLLAGGNSIVLSGYCVKKEQAENEKSEKCLKLTNQYLNFYNYADNVKQLAQEYEFKMIL